MSIYETDYSRQIPVYPGNNYVLLMPCSEVCMHMGIADTVQHVKCEENGVYLNEGRGPHMTHGEAGIYTRVEPNPFGDGNLTIRFAYGLKIRGE